MDVVTGTVLLVFIVMSGSLLSDLKIKRTNSKGETTEISFNQEDENGSL